MGDVISITVVCDAPTRIIGINDSSRSHRSRLRGLREDKLKSIRSYAKFLTETDAA